MKQRYDSYKPSGIEWIGEIPSHWKVVPLRAIAKNFIKGSGITKEDLDDNGDIACIRYGDLYTKYGVSFTQGVCFTNSNKINPKVSIQYGDILLAATGESIEEIGKSSVYLGTGNCLAGGDIIILRQNQNYLFMGYAMSSDSVQSQKSYGKAKLKVVHLKLGDVKSIKIALPPLAEQEAIAAWLDEKCGEIDAAIGKFDREIELIDELKQSEISRVVTRGLNPNALLRPSCIDWIGEIPKHWTKCRFKNFLILHTTPSISDVKIGLENIESKSSKFIQSDSEFEGDGIDFKKGFIVYGKLRPYLQKVWLAEFDGNAIGDFFIFKAKTNAYNVFIKYLLLSDGFTKEADSSTVGAKMPRVSSDFILNMPFYLPPLSEQREIADYLDKKCAEIDGLKAKLKKKRDTLVELRRSMISEVVTGKRKVL